MVDLERFQDPSYLTETRTEDLKSGVLQLVEERDGEAMGKKVRFANEKLMPVFEELARRNPTPNVAEQMPLVAGIWRSVWSTIPFQDILPGRLRDRSYQVFGDDGLYANLARYKPGHRTPILSLFSRWLLSYDLMILQTYGIGTADPSEAIAAPQYWDIQNIGIKQALRFGPAPFTPQVAAKWFERAASTSQSQPDAPIPTRGIDRATAKRYEQVYRSQPQLEHLYIDRDFRIVKSRREASQRPSYTIAVRIPSS